VARVILTAAAILYGLGWISTYSVAFMSSLRNDNRNTESAPRESSSL
jgi:hypothetical protein